MLSLAVSFQVCLQGRFLIPLSPPWSWGALGEGPGVEKEGDRRGHLPSTHHVPGSCMLLVHLPSCFTTSKSYQPHLANKETKVWRDSIICSVNSRVEVLGFQPDFFPQYPLPFGTQDSRVLPKARCLGLHSSPRPFPSLWILGQGHGGCTARCFCGLGSLQNPASPGSGFRMGPQVAGLLCKDLPQEEDRERPQAAGGGR